MNYPLFTTILSFCLINGLSTNFSLNDTSTSLSSLETVKQCLGDYTNFKPNELMFDEPFYLDYGDKTVEIIDFITPKDLKRLRKLTSCIQLNNSSMIDFQIPHENDNKNLGYGNITHLNGYFHTLLRPLYEKIAKISDRVIHAVEWESQKNVTDLGITKCCNSELTFISHNKISKLKIL